MEFDKVDFSILPGRGSGLTFSLIPGIEDGLPDEAKAVHVSEPAFGLIEDCVARAWPAYVEYGHWSISDIPSASWRDIINCLKALRENIEVANSFKDLNWASAKEKSELGRELKARFSTAKPQALSMLIEIENLIEIWVKQYKFIRVEGI